MPYGPLREHLTNRKFVEIDSEQCIGCGLCLKYCPVGEVIVLDTQRHKAKMVDRVACGGCCSCLVRCPKNAIHAVVVNYDDALNYQVQGVRAPGEQAR